MKAVAIDRFGPSDVLEYRDWPTPSPGPRQVLIAVRAASVNPRDWMIRGGKYVFKAMLPKLPFVLGSDVAGVVAAVGPRVRGFEVGDEVFAMQPSSRGFGGYAEFIAIDERSIAPKPQGVPFPEAAAVPLAALTALQALRNDAGLRPGGRVVVIGASGGVGHYGVQIARALGAGTVVGVASGANGELLKDLGADIAVDYRSQRFQDVVDGADVVFDAVGRSSFAECRGVLTRRGTYVTTVPSPGAVAHAVRSRLWPFGKRCRIVLVRAAGEDLRLLGGFMAEGRLRSILDLEVPLERAREAHDHSRSLRTRGKNVLLVHRDDGSGDRSPTGRPSTNC
ncbi:MAG: NADP-dependent oxidoreductase [Acidobacteriota bacterium]